MLNDKEKAEIKKQKARDEYRKRVVEKLWNRGALEYKMHVAQRKIYDQLKVTEARQVLLLISRRWGKSYLATLLAIMDCLRGEGRQVLVIGPSEKQARKIISYLINLIAEDAPRGLIKMTKSENLWTIGKSQLLIAGFDSAIDSVRGLAFYNVYCEELGLANSDDLGYIINDVLRPTLQHSRGKLFYLTTPATSPDHALHTEILPKCEMTNSVFRYTIRDNPLLTEAQIAEEIENMGGMDSISVRRELFAEIIRDASLMAVPDFKVSNICSEVFPDHAYSWIAGDIGGVRDKTVFLMTYYDYMRGVTVIADELVFEPNTPSSKIVELAKQMELQYKVEKANRFVDAPGQLKIDFSSLHSYPLTQVLKGQGSFDAGLNQINVAFRSGALEIHERCKFTILSLNNGTLNKQRNDFQRSSVLGHCDAIAAVVYAYRHRTVNNPYPVKNLDPNTTMSAVRQRLSNVTHALSAIFDD